jgi:hypothetical protein
MLPFGSRCVEGYVPWGRQKRMMRSIRPIRSALVAAAILLGTVGLATPADADGPAAGTPWVVSVGDSYISGEAGRWAGNSAVSPSYTDALGPTAYFDNAANNAETVWGCHRSKSAEVHIFGAVGAQSANFACSGAATATNANGLDFKPGIDFYGPDGWGRKGQARLLQEFAATHNVKMVNLSIGGNDFNFASIVQSCVTNFLLSPSWWKNLCNDDASVVANFTAANLAAKTAAIQGAIANVHTAMAGAGYSASQYTVVVQTYPSPMPNGSGNRYPEKGFSRQNTGGCGFWNADASWANDTALVNINNAVKNAAATSGSNVTVLDLAAAFNGRRLCENTVGKLEEKGLTLWTAPNAVDQTEWIQSIRTITAILGPYSIQESLHPNYWGQLAIRNCVRQAWNNGVPRGGTCTRGDGKTPAGEPTMTLV